MAFRTGRTYSVPGGGTVTRAKSGKAKSYSGRGSAPAGTRKAAAVTAATAPTVTVAPSGQVSTSGFSTPQAASRARRQQRASARRTRQVEREVSREQRQARAAALASVSKQRAERQQRRSQPLSRPTSPPPAPGLTRRPNPEQDPAKAVISSQPKFVTPRERKAARAELRQARAAVRQSRSASPIPLPTPEQRHNARAVLGAGKRQGASHKELLAAAETGLVESYGFKNLPGGDADSQGWRQERTSIYGTGPQGPTNVRASARRFFEEAKTDPGPRATAGQLAQTVQGSAFPERYDARRPEAAAILRAFEGGRPTRAAVRDLKAAKQAALDLGMKVGGHQAGPPPPKLVKRVVVAEHAMKEIEGQPYIWGGGHGSFSEYGKDCSGAVSYVLHKLEVTNTPLTSGAMGSVLEPGRGALTVYYNAGHTFLSYVNRHGKTVYWGTSVGDDGAGGLGPHPAPSKAYLAQYSVGHVPGMGRKQALQLGVEPAALTGTSPAAFPGMTFSADGTTATIASGAGAVKAGKPGPSRRPIRLTPLQRYNRNKRKLKSIGAPISAAPRREEAHPVLDELKTKYGSQAPSVDQRREAALAAAK
jgi:hypothetical protein